MFKNYEKVLIHQARKALKSGEVPVSALATLNGKIIAQAHNQTIKNNDKLAHAEMILIKKLQKKLKTTHFFNTNLVVYVTLEPCCMCIAALAMCGVRDIFYLLEEEKFGGVNKIFVDTAYFQPNLYFVYSRRYHQIIQKFFLLKRNRLTSA